MRVLLVYPNAKREIIGWGDMGAIAEPLALEYIAAVVKAAGHEVKLLDLRIHTDQLDNALNEFQPDLVGVTGYSMHVLRALSVCRRAKELVPHCKTVAGGHHATLEPIDFFEPEIDFVVKGEGTGPMRELLNRLESKEAVTGIAGLWSRVDGQFVFGGEQPEININQIPLPDRTLTVGDRSNYYIDWMRPIALLRTTVGCPYRCSFCSLWRIMDGQYYKREIDFVVDEIATIPEKYIFLVDDEPFVNSKRMRAMAERIAEKGLEKEFFAYCRIDSFLKDQPLMEQWKEIGLKRLLIGVETIFDHELKDYNKRQQRDQIIRALEVAKKIGVGMFCNFIIHPNYTEKEFQAVIQFIKEYEVDYPSFTIWTPIPGTGNNYETVIERQPNGRPNWDYFDLQHPVIETRLPKAEFMKQFENLYQVFAGNYLNSDSPLTVQAYQERQEALKDPAVLLALRVLSLMGKKAAQNQPVSKLN